MDIIEQSQEASDAQQKQHTIEELFETYEVILAFQSQLIAELLKVMNGKGDKKLLSEMCDKLDEIEKMGDAIDHARDCLGRNPV